MSAIEIWEQKLELAEEIAAMSFNDKQSELFYENDRDWGMTFFGHDEGATIASLALALVDLYWNPDSTVLYICRTSTECEDAKKVTRTLMSNLKKIRPERKYAITEPFEIQFGQAKSELKIHTLATLSLGMNSIQTIIIDVPYTSIRQTYLDKYVTMSAPNGRIVIAAGDEAKTTNKKPVVKRSKLDSILDQEYPIAK